MKGKKDLPVSFKEGHGNTRCREELLVAIAGHQSSVALAG
jgi:hypothetical protein